MSLELPDRLDLDLPTGEMPVFPHPLLSGEVLQAWRQRRYLLALEADPELPFRWQPVTVPFELD